MMIADLSLSLDRAVLERLLLEETTWDGGRADITILDQGVRVAAPDATSLRAALNSILKVLQVHERMESVA